MGGGCLDEGPYQDQPISHMNGGILFVGIDLRGSDGLVSIYECCGNSRVLLSAIRFLGIQGPHLGKIGPKFTGLSICFIQLKAGSRI
jgi:hypothetical protein